MPGLRITKEDVKRADKARKEALKNDPEFRAFEEEQEKLRKKAFKKNKKEKE